MSGKKEKTLIPPPETSFLMKLLFPLQAFYVWVIPTIWKGFFGSLEMKDIPEVNKSHRVKSFEKRFEKIWKFTKGWKMRLLWTTQLCFGLEFWFAGILKLIATICNLMVTIFMTFFLQNLYPYQTDAQKIEMEFANSILPENLQPGDIINARENDWMVWIWLGLMVLCSIMYALFDNYATHMCVKVAIKTRAAISNKIFKKMMVLSNKAKVKYENGIVLSIVGTDLNRMDQIYQMFHNSWTGFVQLIVSIYFLVTLIDWGALTGCITYAVIMPSIFIIMIGIMSTRKRFTPVIDDRVNLTTETIQGIRILKFFSWENIFKKKIQKIRKKESFGNLIISFIMAFMGSIQSLMIPCVCVVSFCTYYFVHGYLDPIAIYTSMTYFRLLQMPINMLALVNMFLAECLVALNRIQGLLEAEEAEIQERFNEEDPIIIENGDFQWEKALNTGKNENKKKKETKITF